MVSFVKIYLVSVFVAFIFNQKSRLEDKETKMNLSDFDHLIIKPNCPFFLCLDPLFFFISVHTGCVLNSKQT